MAAGRYSFVIEQGATTDFEVAYNDSTGTPVDLTGYQAKMQIRSNYGSSGTLYLTLSSSLDSCGMGLKFKWFPNIYRIPKTFIIRFNWSIYYRIFIFIFRF